MMEAFLFCARYMEFEPANTSVTKAMAIADLWQKGFQTVQSCIK